MDKAVMADGCHGSQSSRILGRPYPGCGLNSAEPITTIEIRAGLDQLNQRESSQDPQPMSILSNNTGQSMTDKACCAATATKKPAKIAGRVMGISTGYRKRPVIATLWSCGRKRIQAPYPTALWNLRGNDTKPCTNQA